MKLAGGVQNVLGSAVVHHESVLAGGTDVIRDAYQRRPLVPQNYPQDLEVLGGRRVVRFLYNLAVRCVQCFTCVLC
jgi:hypothetical protein